MIVTKDTKLTPAIISVEIHSIEEAALLFKKGDALAKIADEVRGSALDWVKQNDRDRYPDFVADMGIKLDMANKLIAHSKLVAVAKSLGEDVPNKASSTAYLKGKSPQAKIKNYNHVKEVTGKQEPTQSDIVKVNKKKPILKEILKNNKLLIKKSLRNEEIVEAEVVDNKPLQEEIVKLKAALKREKALKEKYYKELTAIKSDINKLHEDISDAVEPLEDIMDELREFMKNEEARAKIKHQELSFKKMNGDVEKALKAFNLTELSDLAKLKKVHRELVKKVHPDKGGSIDDFTYVDYNYKTLKDFYTFRDAL